MSSFSCLVSIDEISIISLSTLRSCLLEDAIYADRIFSVLMGERVEPRKQFIQEHAREVVNLDT